jgi:hypothetical protein
MAAELLIWNKNLCVNEFMQSKQKKSNPQGKGVVPVVNHWYTYEPVVVEKKSTGQLFAEYFTSLLILSADFRFKPVQGANYFLYLKKQCWVLSLIEPERWSYERRGEYFGSCQLQEDMTWSIDTIDLESVHPDVDQALKLFYQQIALHLDSEKPLIEILPFYLDELPYYRRMAATGLARSMRHSFGEHALLDKPSKNVLSALQLSNHNSEFLGIS